MELPYREVRQDHQSILNAVCRPTELEDQVAEGDVEGCVYGFRNVGTQTRMRRAEPDKELDAVEGEEEEEEEAEEEEELPEGDQEAGPENFRLVFDCCMRSGHIHLIVTEVCDIGVECGFVYGRYAVDEEEEDGFLDECLVVVEKEDRRLNKDEEVSEADFLAAWDQVNQNVDYSIMLLMAAGPCMGIIGDTVLRAIVSSNFVRNARFAECVFDMIWNGIRRLRRMNIAGMLDGVVVVPWELYWSVCCEMLECLWNEFVVVKSLVRLFLVMFCECDGHLEMFGRLPEFDGFFDRIWALLDSVFALRWMSSCIIMLISANGGDSFIGLDRLFHLMGILVDLLQTGIGAEKILVPMVRICWDGWIQLLRQSGESFDDEPLRILSHFLPDQPDSATGPPS
jgi:hypothetical protein